MKTDELLKPLGSAQLGSKFCQNEFSFRLYAGATFSKYLLLWHFCFLS